MEAKSQMRSDVISRRNAMDAAVRADKSARICEELLALASATADKDAPSGRPFTVAAFRAMGSEADLAAFCTGALERGWRLCLPTVARTADNGRQMLFVQVEPNEILSGNLPAALTNPMRAFSIDGPELAGLGIVPLADIDFMAVPLVAFDGDGGRLGYGGGHYDRALAALGPETVAVGAAFTEQQVPQVPREPWDRPLARVATA